MEIFPTSPPPLSPPNSPPSPPSPPKILAIRYDHPVHYNRPVRPVMAEFNLGYADYLIPEGEEGYFTDLTWKEVKEIMINPFPKPEIFQNMILYVNSDIAPIHVPQFHDACHLPKKMKVFLKWLLEREGGVEKEERDLFQNMGQWLDPAPLLPPTRTMVMVMNRQVRLQAMSNTDAVLLARLRRPMRQMEMCVNWVEARGLEFPREAEVYLIPLFQKWINVAKKKEVMLWEPGNEVLRAKYLKNPLLPNNMTILFWNVRGMGRPSFKPNLRLLINQHHPSIIILVETRVPKHTTETIIQNLGFDSWHIVEPRGFAGGIVLLWHANDIKLQVMGESAQGVHGVVEVCSSSKSFVLSSVYASPKYVNRKHLWQELSNMAGNVNCPWLVIGDFNEITNQGEKFGGRPIKQNRARLYVHTMDTCNLLDMGYNGQKYTWSNMRRNNPIFERLDRGWVNLEWMATYPNSSLWTLPRVTSDHCPLVVKLDHPIPRLGSRPFRFEPMWLMDRSFKDNIGTSWPKEGGEIGDMLYNLQNVLVDWNLNNFGNVYKRKRRALARLEGTQKALQNNPNSGFFHDLESELRAELVQILMQEEELWATKNKLERIKEGERNTRYFHRSVMIKRNASRIMSLRNEVGLDIRDPIQVRDHIQNFFQTLYTTEQVQCNWEMSISQQLIDIAYPPSNEEIREALRHMKPNKAPGPDGFHPIFFQKMWEVVGKDICHNIRSWFGQRKVPESMCQAVICLIPKQNPPETVKHLRPISLCNTVYKIATKVIVNRLKPLIPYWISPNQNSFIKGRGPDVNLVVASEILHSMNKKKGKNGWFALKIDLEKAYDRIEWSFVKTCLRNLNLSDSSIDLIMSCISQSSSSILVNGRQTDSFKHSRGLRQGDPMSPYLFNICLEHLSHMINQAMLDKTWTPFWVGKDKVPISHLMFADDLLIFGRVDEVTTFTVRKVLRDFCSISGQRINESKSRLIFSPNTPLEHKELFQQTLNIEENQDLGMYLGLPLSHKRPTRKQVQFVVDKVKAKLANWKTKYLSRAGRLCLISSTLATIPAYYMQATFLPSATLKDLDRVCNNFLWGEEEGKRKIHLVGKNRTFKPKEWGGLGIRDQTLMNNAYMAKLGWKLSQGPANLAQKCIMSKYIHKHYVTSFAKGSPIWQSVGKGWPLLAHRSQWIVGDGKDIDFWQDDWLGIGPIRTHIEGPLGEMESQYRVSDVSQEGGWNLDILSIPLPPGIVSRILDLQHPGISKQNDILAPLYLSAQGFSLSLAYQTQILSEDNIDLGWVWKMKTTPKINFFLWLACLDRLPHNRLLVERRVTTHNSCPRCQQQNEDTNHILRTCPESQKVWDIIPTFDLQLGEGVSSWIQEQLRSKREFRRLAWPSIFPYLCFEIWKSRNHVVFNPSKKPLSAQTIVTMACNNALEFVRANQVKENIAQEHTLGSLMDHIPHSWVMVNVDAAFKSQNQVSGTGGIIRDSKGGWIMGFTKTTFARDALLAELKAIHEGLTLALNHGHKKVVLFSDCKVATTLLDHEVSHTNIYANIINKCRELRRKFDNLMVRYCSRNYNKIADMMAKECGRNEDPEICNRVPRILHIPPTYCMDIYIAECMSVVGRNCSLELYDTLN